MSDEPDPDRGLVIGCLGMILLVIIVIGAAINAIHVSSAQHADCAARGGTYVSSGRGGNDTCVKDGLIIKVY